MSNLDFKLALKDEEYARDIVIDKRKSIIYDDYIFVLSAIYASNIPLKDWIKKYKENNSLLTVEFECAQVTHCYSWENAILDIVETANLLLPNNAKFKGITESRNWVQKTLHQNCLKHL